MTKPEAVRRNPRERMGMNRLGWTADTPMTERSGWVIPLAVFFTTACLSAFALAYYFAPAAPGLIQEQPAPTDATRPIEASIAAERLRVPANYILFASARRGGAMQQLAMIAILPDLEGYTLGAAADFTGNAPDSRVVNILLKTGRPVLPEQQRLDRIYLIQSDNPAGKAGPYGLKQYTFRADSGYHEQDMFVGTTDTGPVVLLCAKISPDIAAPSCMRDFPLHDGLSISYRFRRAHLAEWRTLDSGVRALLAKFAGRS